MAKIWMITSGGDWADASADLVATDVPVAMDKLHELYRDWYQNSYLPDYHAQKRPTYLSFHEWLISTGHARKPLWDEAESFET